MLGILISVNGQLRQPVRAYVHCREAGEQRGGISNFFLPVHMRGTARSFKKCEVATINE